MRIVHELCGRGVLRLGVGERGQHSGVAQMLWYLGPVIVLISFFILEPFGILGARIVFAHLAALALALTFLRSRMRESEKWEAARASASW